MRLCPVCGDLATGYESATEKVETYDASAPMPGERLTPVPAQLRAAPGATVETWHPCGHQRVTR